MAFSLEALPYLKKLKIQQENEKENRSGQLEDEYPARGSLWM